MNNEYVPYNEEEASAFESRLERNMLYRSTDNFMALYNNNLINRANPEIDEVAKQITDVYKNIYISNRKFIVKSKEEVISEEFEVLFPHISFLATLKRIASDILKDDYNENTLMVFSDDDSNSIKVFDESLGEATNYEGAERIRNVNKSVASNPFLVNNISMQPFGEDGEGIAFKAIDILSLDTSFINDIGELLESYLEK